MTEERSPEKNLKVQFQRHIPAGAWYNLKELRSLVNTIDEEIIFLSYVKPELIEDNDLVITVSLRPL